MKQPKFLLAMSLPILISACVVDSYSEMPLIQQVASYRQSNFNHDLDAPPPSQQATNPRPRLAQRPHIEQRSHPRPRLRVSKRPVVREHTQLAQRATQR